MAEKTPIRSTGIREMWGIILLTFAVLTALALASYDWADISLLRTPPNDPPLNFIGPVGAWTAFLAFMTLGLGAFLLPALAAVLGLFLLLYPRTPFLARGGWSLLALLVAAAFIPLFPAWCDHFCLRLNIRGLSGGLFGWLVADRLLCSLLGHTGAAILLGGLLCASVVMFVGRPALVRLAHAARAGCAILIARVRAAQAARRSRLELLEREARTLARQRETLEKELRRNLPKRPPEPAPAPAAAPPPLPPPPPPPPAPAPPAPAPVKPAARAAAKPAPAGESPELPPRIAAPASPYRLPSISLLHQTPDGNDRQIDWDVHSTAKVLKETLAEFGIECEVTNIEQGPVVTRYELRPAPGVRVENIVKLQNNLQLMMKATSVRVQAPIPGKDVVGIEVPNAIATKVYLREILESEPWKNSRAAIPLVLGKDVGGSDLVADLAAMPHLLIAGATGSGKTVCMNSILAGMLMSRTPDELRLILVDPKIVEFSIYNNLPHLATPVITDHKKVIFGLRWAINEMNKRYKLFARAGVRNIAGYNERMHAHPPEPGGNDEEAFPAHVPYIVIVIDELADLMMVARADIENAIARLAQLSRAVGIHMILATQRPSVNVITGTIKANFPARISFQVAQKVDSRTILDTSGADKLLGRGDMLFLPPGSSKLVRAQGAMTTDDDIHSIVEFIKQQALPAKFEIPNADEAEGKPAGMPGLPGTEDEDDADDDLLEAATNIIRETRRASVSLLQRRLKIGYNRAGRLMDVLEERGIVGPARGSDPREILIDLDLQTSDNPPADTESPETSEGTEWNQSDKS